MLARARRNDPVDRLAGRLFRSQSGHGAEREVCACASGCRRRRPRWAGPSSAGHACGRAGGPRGEKATARSMIPTPAPCRDSSTSPSTILRAPRWTSRTSATESAAGPSATSEGAPSRRMRVPAGTRLSTRSRLLLVRSERVGSLEVAVGSAGGAWAVRRVLARLAWFPPAAVIEPCMRFSRTRLPDVLHRWAFSVPAATAGWVVARRWFR
jgi:hypothetical protein